VQKGHGGEAPKVDPLRAAPEGAAAVAEAPSPGEQERREGERQGAWWLSRRGLARGEGGDRGRGGCSHWG
jgi:hypothetical protein